MTNIEKLKKFSEKPWFYPMALFLIGLISYEYVLKSMGFYWADWEILMFTKLNPTLQFGFYAGDRPFPWTYQLIHFLVGSKPIGWHIATLLIRWSGTLFFVNFLVLLWPRYKKHFFWLGALLIVYPGFLQQLQSVTKARHIMTLMLFALSLYLMALAIQRPKWARILFPLSWIATFAHLFTTEYFSGFELLRPVLLWLLIADKNNKKLPVLRQVVVYSLPYLLITAFFFWCRFVYFPEIFQTTSRLGDINSTVSGLRVSIAESFMDLFDRAFVDLIYSTLQVWFNTLFKLDGFGFQRISAWFAFGLGIALTFAFSFFYDTNEDEKKDPSSPASVFVLGFVAFILSALPVWAIGKDISTGGWNDRFALAPMLGAGLMVVGFLIWLVRPLGQKIILGFLLVFSIATQAWVVNIYRRDWSTQLDYYWQLHWRVPSMQSGTAIFSYELPSTFMSHDVDASYAINVLYDYRTDDGSIPYWFTTPENEIYFQPGNDFKNRKRNLVFNGNTSNAIAVLHQTGGSCLRVLDTIYSHDPLFHEGHDMLIPVSNLSRIIPDPGPVYPDRDIFGAEPAHTWCYFFEKADLARQTGDWNEILDLYDQAQQLNLTPKIGAEYLPFIEAYAQTGEWQKAFELTITAQKLASGYNRMLCSNWDRLGRLQTSDMNVVEQVDQTLSC